VLLDRAAARDRLGWIAEEMRRYDDPALYEETVPEAQLDRVRGRGLGALSPLQRAVLRELAAWREREARRRDLPRRRVLDDEALIETARQLPERIEALRVPGTPEKVLRRHAGALLDAVRRGRAVLPEARPTRPPPEPDEDRLQALTGLIQAFVAGHCAREGVDPQLVATKADLRVLVAAGPQADPTAHALLQGWRSQFVGEAVLGVLRGIEAVTVDAGDGWPRRAS
jgi:ribonuclease D